MGGFGYSITIDKVNEKIYFGANFDDGGDRFILTSDLDGSNISEFAVMSGRVYGISIDNTNNKVYWSETGTSNVFAQNIDGTNRTTLSTDLNDPLGLFHIE